MNTLLLRLNAPLQSWGVQSNYTVRDSGLEPSKSGVIGLICAALGRPREASLEDLIALQMAVRVDREGILRNDFHIAQDVLDTNGKATRDSIITNRYYLAGAAFLVGLAGDDLALLQTIQAALQNPKWALFFGRKAFTPAAPVLLRDGLHPERPLEAVLKDYGWTVRWREGSAPATVRVVLESQRGEQVRGDVPLSFAERRFATRRVTTEFWPAPAFLSREVL